MNAYAMHNEALAVATLRRALEDGGTDLDESDIDTLIEGESSLKEMLSRMVDAIAADEADVSAIKHRMAELDARATRKSERAKQRRAAILAALEIAGVRKIELPEATVSMNRGRPGVVIMDADAVPFEYMREKVTRAPDLAKIAEALKTGTPVSGVVMSNSAPTIAIRRA